MKHGILTSTIVITVFAALAISIRLTAQNLPEQSANMAERYNVISLGSLGGTSCCLVTEINDRSWVDGTSNLAGDQNFHPFLWIGGQMTDLGTLGGPNASVGGLNEVGDVTVGGSDTGTPDPLGEDFCGFGTHQTCLSFVWHDGRRTPIPTLGGNNNDVNTINNQGQVLAFAETANPDPTCIAPQVLGFEAFIWEPKTGAVHELPPLPGDSISVGFGLNENGQVAGTSGICVSVTSSGAAALHVVLWQNAKPTDLGNLGGTIFNVAFGINNLGQVVGISDLPGDTTFHAFLWQKGVMADLGTLPGDFFSVGSGINDKGQVAIQSCDVNFSCRAALWQNGVMTDLNTLTPPGSPLFLLVANSINSRGQIVGAAFDQSTGTIVPFLATPSADSAMQAGGNPTPKVTLPENVRELLRQRMRFGRFGAGPTKR